MLATVPYERLAVASRVTIENQSVYVYGSVLPWRGIRGHAPDLLHPDEKFQDAFSRMLEEQSRDVSALIEQASGAPVVWAGDFNQTLYGPNWTGTNSGRVALGKALSALGFAAWNADSPHFKVGASAIDLICGPSQCRVLSVECIDPRIGNRCLSDHVGYVVEIE